MSREQHRLQPRMWGTPRRHVVGAPDAYTTTNPSSRRFTIRCAGMRTAMASASTTASLRDRVSHHQSEPRMRSSMRIAQV